MYYQSFNGLFMKKTFLPILAAVSIVCGCSKSKTTDTTPPQMGGVTTYVGSGIAGLVNAIGTNAALSGPTDIVVDVAGNLYISEYGNNVIRRVAPGGAVTTFAGDGTAGYKDGALDKAEFNDPEGMVIDQVGNLYIADAGNHVIREITVAGQVITFAGNGTSGHVDGTGNVVEFASPKGLAMDKAKNIYVADYGNNVIRKISSTGTVTTFAGNGTAGSNNGDAANSSFHGPSGLTIDGSNNLYVSESSNGDIRQIIPSGTVSTFATGLTSPVRVTIDGSSNLYASCGDNTIQKIDNTGKVSVYAGSGAPGFNDGSLLQSEFDGPVGVISNPQGVLIVADNGNNRIRVVTP
jgi:streptogramin lyase